jgi:hypothetical protein
MISTRVFATLAETSVWKTQHELEKDASSPSSLVEEVESRLRSSSCSAPTSRVGIGRILQVFLRTVDVVGNVMLPM